MPSGRCEVHPLYCRIPSTRKPELSYSTYTLSSSSTRISSFPTKDGENERSETWRNYLFPVGMLFSHVRQPGARGPHPASTEWGLFLFGTKVGALGQATPWTLLHEPVNFQPLVCPLTSVQHSSRHNKFTLSMK